MNETAFPTPVENRGLQHPGIIDLMTHEAHGDRVEITMFEPRPWDGGDEQLFQLQEKLNAYLSFILDGELAETAPTLVGKPTTVVLRCAEIPPPEAIDFLAAVREQIGHQGLDLEVRYKESVGGGRSCASGCSCGA